MRKSDFFLIYLTLNILLLLSLSAHALFQTAHAEPFLRRNGEIVKKLELTDLCLFTEANYTRHLTQADTNTAFQDHPCSLEHFPSGSFLVPPKMRQRFHEKID